MKVLIETTDFTKEKGIQRLVVELTEKLLREDVVHLVTSDYKHRMLDGLVVHNVANIKRPPSMLVASTVIQYSRLLPKIKRKYGLEVVHTQGADSVYSDVISMHSCHKAAVSQFKRERGTAYRVLKTFEPLSNIILQIERHNLRGRNYKKLAAVSNSVKDDVMRYYGVPEEDVAVVYPGINVDEFNPENRNAFRGGIRGKHGLGADDVVMMFSGWEYKRKGLMAIVQALPKIKDKAKLIVVGKSDPTPYINEARSLGVEDRMVFAGVSKDIRQYYAAADMFVFPTVYEPFGLVITEAMASGLPVVTSRIAGAAELVRDGADGLLLDDPKNPSEVADRVNEVLGQGMAKMGANARKTAEGYTWDRMADCMRKVYKEALEK